MQRNLVRTIASIRNQTSDRWVVYICGQTRPERIEFDEKVRFVKFNKIKLPILEKGVFGYDQGDKRVMLIDTALRNHSGEDGYYARWDGDDLVHPEAVAYIHSDNNGRGYLVERGIMADLDEGHFGQLGDPAIPNSKPFWRLCGSSSFVRFDFRSQPKLWREQLMRHSSHKGLVKWMEASGLPLTPIPFDAAIYSYNNGENMSTRKGSGQRGKHIKDNQLMPDAVAQVRETFDLDRILALSGRTSEVVS